jgi:HK97 family phage major capsid protein
MKITSELLSDEQTNLQQFLTADIARAYAQAVNDAIINGTGSSQPYGVLARAFEQRHRRIGHRRNLCRSAQPRSTSPAPTSKARLRRTSASP